MQDFLKKARSRFNHPKKNTPNIQPSKEAPTSARKPPESHTP
jgi:hypothetical protein